MEDADGFDDILLHFGLAGFAPVVEVDEFEFKTDAAGVDEDIFGVDVGVIFVHAVDIFKAADELVENAHGDIGRNAIAAVVANPAFEGDTFAEFTDHDDDALAADGDFFAVVVLEDDGALAEFVEFSSVLDGGVAFGGGVGVVNFSGTEDAGAVFADAVDFAFAARAEETFNGVMFADTASGREIEGLARFGHWGVIHLNQ